MKNRLLKTIVAGLMITAAFAATGCAGGKKSEKYKIGISQFAEHGSLDNCREGFLAGLKEAGLVEGTDFEVEYQNAGAEPATATQIAQSFSAGNVDIMVGIATPSATACYAAAEDKNIPVIFTAITSPESAGLVDGNTTGTSDKLPVSAQLELIRKLQPEAKTIGIIYTTSEQNSVAAIAEYNEKAGDYGFTIRAIGIAAQAEVTQAADTLIAEKIDCISNLTDNTVVDVLASVLEKTNEAKIPVYGSEIEQVKIGCVAAAGIDYYQLGIRTGKIAARVLRGEAECDAIPYESIADYEIYANIEALAGMGITIPQDITYNKVTAQ